LNLIRLVKPGKNNDFPYFRAQNQKNRWTKRGKTRTYIYLEKLGKVPLAAAYGIRAAKP
jgi:hypothetical protein